MKHYIVDEKTLKELLTNNQAYEDLLTDFEYCNLNFTPNPFTTEDFEETLSFYNIEEIAEDEPVTKDPADKMHKEIDAFFATNPSADQAGEAFAKLLVTIADKKNKTFSFDEIMKMLPCDKILEGEKAFNKALKDTFYKVAETWLLDIK